MYWSENKLLKNGLDVEATDISSITCEWGQSYLKIMSIPNI